MRFRSDFQCLHEIWGRDDWGLVVLKGVFVGRFGGGWWGNEGNRGLGCGCDERGLCVWELGCCRCHLIRKRLDFICWSSCWHCCPAQASTLAMLRGCSASWPAFQGHVGYKTEHSWSIAQPIYTLHSKYRSYYHKMSLGWLLEPYSSSTAHRSLNDRARSMSCLNQLLWLRVENSSRWGCFRVWGLSGW